MRENPLVSIVSILGTALSIAMVLVVVLTFQINMVGYAPESNRNRILYVPATQAAPVEGKGGGSNNGQMSSEVVKECFYPLQTPEAVTAFSTASFPISLPGKRLFKEYAVKYTDDGFWRIFDFTFLSGKAFTEADFQSGIPKAVVSQTMAAQLFGSEDPIGQSIIMDDVTYAITGVVKSVSKKADMAHADVWAPYSTNPGLLDNLYCDGICGRFRTVILARSTSDFGKIKEELKQLQAKYNEGKQDMNVNFMHSPLTRMEMAAGGNGFNETKLRDYIQGMGAQLLFLLLIPALNLVGFITSSIQKRRSEVGIRKAFGASHGTIVYQVLYENLLATSIGGVLGLGLSFLLLKLSTSFILTTGMLVHPLLFIAGIFFVLLLNLLSAGIPAIRIARQQIVNSLRGSEE